MKFKPSLNTGDFLVMLAVVMVGLAVHQKFVAPKIAKKQSFFGDFERGNMLPTECRNC